MRVVVSDYDGTLKIFQKPMDPGVVDAIHRWRDAGNRFGIASGRDYEMMIHEIRAHGIPFDFLILANGGAIYDAEENLLQATFIDNALIPQILSHPAGLDSSHYQLFAKDKIYFFERRKTFFSDLGVPYVPVDFEAALALKDLVQISFWYRNHQEPIDHVKTLIADFGDRAGFQTNVYAIDINRKEVNKAWGIGQALSLLGLDGAEVHAVGDGGNDVDMIRRYNGYTVAGAVPEAKAAARKVYADAAEMLNDLL